MFARLLVAIDESPSTQVVLDFATALARRGATAIHVLHVNPLLVGGRGHAELTETEAARLVEAAVRQLRQQLRDCDVKVTGSLARATCFQLHQVIAETAEARHSDAIVVGSRRRRGVRRIFGHGLRERVTGLSPLPVLVAPAPLEVSGGHRFGHHSAAIDGPTGSAVSSREAHPAGRRGSSPPPTRSPG